MNLIKERKIFCDIYQCRKRYWRKIHTQLRFTLKLDIQPDGSVSSCTIPDTELNDKRLLRRLTSKCKQMSFKPRSGIAVTTVEFPIRFMP